MRYFTNYTKRRTALIVCTPLSASDAVSPLLFFTRRNRVVFPRDPVAPASAVQLHVVEARFVQCEHVRASRHAGTAVNDNLFRIPQRGKMLLLLRSRLPSAVLP